MSERESAQRPAHPSAGGRDRSAIRWLGIALVLSLAINAFVVGIVATKAFKFRESRRSGPPPVVDALADLNRMLRGFPRERRDELRRMVRPTRNDLKPQRAELDRLRNEMARVLRQDPLDRAALDRVLREVQSVRAAMRDTGRQILIQVVEALTPAERVALAERLERRTKKRRTKKAQESPADSSGEVSARPAPAEPEAPRPAAQ